MKEQRRPLSSHHLHLALLYVGVATLAVCSALGLSASSSVTVHCCPPRACFACTHVSHVTRSLLLSSGCNCACDFRLLASATRGQSGRGSARLLGESFAPLRVDALRRQCSERNIRGGTRTNGFVHEVTFSKMSYFSMTATMFQAVLSFAKAFLDSIGEQGALGNVWAARTVRWRCFVDSEHEAVQMLLEEASERLTAHLGLCVNSEEWRHIARCNSKGCSHFHCVSSRRFFDM